MRTYMLSILLAGLLAFGVGWSPGANAAVVTNTTDQLFNAVDEVSSTLTAAPKAELTIFVNGTYAAGNTVVLQEEVGSPGSGAWTTVLTLTDGTANKQFQISYTTGPGTTGYRLNMTATGTGAVTAYLTDHNTTARTFINNATFLVHRDEFIDQDSSPTAVTAAKYSTEVSDSGGSLIASVSVAVNEGALTITSGTTSQDGACFSTITADAFGSDISVGWTVFEVRLKSDNLNGLVGIGFSDQVCADTTDTIPTVDIDSGVVSQVDGESESLAVFARQDEATDVDGWQVVSAIADAEGSNALEVSVGTQAAAAYQILRVEIDSLGNAYWYIDGALVYVEPLAVTVTAILVPTIFTTETVLNVGASITLVDYILFVMPRPAG